MLPNDLIQVILDSCENWRYRDLVSLARVNSYWLAHVRLILYRQPQIVKFSSLYLLVRSLAENGTQLLPLITGLELCPVSDDDTGFLCQSAATALSYLLGLQVQQLILGGALAIRAGEFNPTQSPSSTPCREVFADDIDASRHSEALHYWQLLR